MSLFKNMTYQDDIKDVTDSVGGGYQLLESGVYDATIKHAYVNKAKSGAIALSVAFDIDGQIHNEDFYFQSKKGVNYYVNKNGDKHYLPSFILADDLSLFTAQIPLAEQDTQNKVIELYNFEARKKVPTEVAMVMSMLDKPIKIGLLKQISFKQTEQNGKWVDTEEIKEKNIVDVIFSPTDGRTVREVRAKKDNAEFINTWQEKWKGVNQDKTKSKTPNVNSNTTATKSLFS